MSEHFIEAFGNRFPRSICGRCGLPLVWLGESIRVDLAEGGFVILPICLPCVRRARAIAALGIRREAA